MADQVDPAPPVASASDEVADNAPTTDEAKLVETGLTEAEEQKEANAVKSDKEMDESTNTNGHTQNETSSTEAAKEDQGAEDTKMDDAGPSSAAAPATPATNKKAASGSSKKKAGVPEHKSKKLNKKKSKPALRLDVKPGELYLARMKGHPPWPSIVCDEEMLPESLTTTRPVTTALPDGTFKKPEYADGGKRAYERTYPIMFLRTNEFAWIPNTELTPLSPEECKDVPEKGKQKALKEAYEIAAEDHDLSYFKTMLGEHAKALREDEQLRAEKEAEKEAKKARQAKRKSTATVTNDEEADEMDIDEEGEPKPKATKKRKKSLDSDGEEKPAKTPKTNIKLKITTPKTPTESSAKKVTKAKPRKSAAKVEEEEEAEDVPVPEEKPLSPAEAKDKKEKEIKYYRHKLQKGFLSRDNPPDDEETKSMSSFLNKLENHQDLEGSIIRATKIHKVLKAMIRLSSIPLDETYKFKERCVALLALWNKTLSDDPSAAAEANEGAEGTEPKTNGVGGEDHTAENGEKADEKDAEAAAAPEEKEGTLEGKIGTNVEGEKEAEKGTEDDAVMEDAKETDAPDVENKPEEAYVPPAEPVEASA